MPGSPNNSSFIPKQGTIKKRRTVRTKQIYLFTAVSYILMFAALLSAGGVFIYKSYVHNQFNKIAISLDEEIKSFNVSEFNEILKFDGRIAQATDRAYKNVSLTSIFSAIEQATVESVQFDELSIERVKDDEFEMQAVILTDSFDSTIFQRGTYRRNDVVGEVSISDFKTIPYGRSVQDGEFDPERMVGEDEEFLVGFSANFVVPLNKVLYTGENNVAADTYLMAPTPAPSESKNLLKLFLPDTDQAENTVNANEQSL